MRDWYTTHLFPTSESLSLLFILQEWIATCEWLEQIRSSKVEEWEGKLAKLCFYSEILLQASQVDGEKLLMILEEIRQIFVKLRLKHLALQTLSEEWIETAKQKFCDFFLALHPFLQKAKKDENVLLYLIEQRQAFNFFLGSHAVEELLQSLCPSGEGVLREMISNGFAQRGFSSFLATKEPLLEEIEWPRSN